MKKVFLLLVFCSMFLAGFSQPYRNEWINFSSNGDFSDQKYYKIKVTTEGIYRIKGSTLLSQNIPISTIATSRYQLFYHGVEQYIYIDDNLTAGVLDPNDYIEFYGMRNDGKLDQELYVNTLNNYYYTFL